MYGERCKIWQQIFLTRVSSVPIGHEKILQLRTARHTKMSEMEYLEYKMTKYRFCLDDILT